MTRTLRSTVAVLAVSLLGVATQAQPNAPTAGAPREKPPRAGIDAMRKQLTLQVKHTFDLRAQEIAAEIGPPPAGCGVDVSYIEHSESGEAIAEFITDVFRHASWDVEMSAREPLMCTTCCVLIDSSPSTVTVAAKLQAALNQLVPTDIAPAGIDRDCSLRIVVSP
jgi:ferredoxin